MASVAVCVALAGFGCGRRADWHCLDGIWGRQSGCAVGNAIGFVFFVLLVGLVCVARLCGLVVWLYWLCWFLGLLDGFFDLITPDDN